MSFQKPPIDRDDPSKDWIRVHQMERDKKQNDYKNEEPPSNQIALMTSHLAGFIKKIFFFLTPFSSISKSEIAALDRQYLIDQLQIFKSMLLVLSKEDQSAFPHFIQGLSEVWHKLSLICNNESMNRKFPEETLKLKLLIKQILIYPPEEDHSFGSYLFKQVGTTWLPFPFIEIIQKLHYTYQKDPKLSELSMWITFLSDLIQKLTK